MLHQRLIRLLKMRGSDTNGVSTAETQGGRHHPAFARFPIFNGEVPGGFQLEDFLGSISRLEFRGVTPRAEPTFVQSQYPPFGDDYFEWIAILESVIAARSSYTMFELGAGFGRWAVTAAMAAKRFNPNMPVQITAVEAEPVHFAWMRTHFADNGFNPDQHRLIHAAINDSPGAADFYIEFREYEDPRLWYGQSLAPDHDPVEEIENDSYLGHKVRRHKTGAKSISIPTIRLAELLDPVDKVDLIDLDIQGEEGNAIRSSIEVLNRKVKRLHIGTHSPVIEAELRELLSAHRWICKMDFAGSTTHATEFGTIAFGDGTQSWVNPRFQQWFTPWRR